jgi:agarase
MSFFSSLANFYLFVSDQPFVSTDLQTTINQSGVWNSYTAGAVSTSSTIAVNRSGRYVRVQLAATDVLSLELALCWEAEAAFCTMS